MKNIILAANWKMNGSLANNENLINCFKDFKSDKAQIIIFPPYLYLSQISELLKNTNISFGAQDASEFESGAYTGQISVNQLKDVGCKYCIIGHSERRSLCQEDSDLVARKVKAVLSQNITPILCVGENKQEREETRAFEVVERQLAAVVNLLGIEKFSGIIIAYEPVWAIGTGLVATPEQAEEMHEFIRKFLNNIPNLKILYGGSVNANNAAQLLTQKNIDGALIGGASLKGEEFLKICEETARI